MNSVKISVAMTTYNGEKYIYDQLESIRLQKVVPNEVIICDDQSKDRTIEIVEKFINDYKLAGWSIVRNDTNLGWMFNFYKAAQLVQGDIIFFSDQDDIWFPNKIETMRDIMIAEKAKCVYGQKSIIDESGNSLLKREEKLTYSNKIIKIKYKKNFFNKKVLGCCMCISRELINFYLSINAPEAGHDSQCARLALLTDSLWMIDKPVIKYRIHNSNTSGISADVSFGASSVSKRKAEIINSINWMEKLIDSNLVDPAKKNSIEKSIKVQKIRLEYLKSKKCFMSLMPYILYYNDLTMFIGDFAYRHNFHKAMGRFRWIIRKRR